LRAHIASLSKQAEKNGLIPVLLLFFDHDPAGLKITDTFEDNLYDCARGTGWRPDKMVIERFGLNADDIEGYDLMWIDNLKTGSGRESDDYEYIRRFGERKCEANALFKNDETLKAGVEICRRAIEKYYGKDAKDRFEKKEEEAKKGLTQIYADPMWSNISEKIDEMIDSYSIGEEERKEEFPQDQEKNISEEVDVKIDDKHYGLCPRCNCSFDYSTDDDGRLVKCRDCGLSMRLRLEGT